MILSLRAPVGARRVEYSKDTVNASLSMVYWVRRKLQEDAICFDIPSELSVPYIVVLLRNLTKFVIPDVFKP